MTLKQMKHESLPPEIEESPLSRTGLGEMGLSQRTKRGLLEEGFETAGDVASRSAEELKAFCYFTPSMIAEVEEALGRLGLTLRKG